MRLAEPPVPLFVVRLRANVRLEQRYGFDVSSAGLERNCQLQSNLVSPQRRTQLSPLSRELPSLKILAEPGDDSLVFVLQMISLTRHVAIARVDDQLAWHAEMP